jgi:hypothetical protein
VRAVERVLALAFGKNPVISNPTIGTFLYVSQASLRGTHITHKSQTSIPFGIRTQNLCRRGAIRQSAHFILFPYDRWRNFWACEYVCFETQADFVLALFRGWGGEVKNVWKIAPLITAVEKIYNYFVCLLVGNTTFLKLCVFKVHLATDEGSYGNRNVLDLLTKKPKPIKSCTQKIKASFFKFSENWREYLPQTH